MDSSAQRRWFFLSEALAAERPPVIVDIGANPIDEPAYKALLLAGLCRLEGFEPQPEAFASLLSMMGPNERYHNMAVGDGSSVPFYVYRESGLSSVFELDRSAMKFMGRASGPATCQEVLTVETRQLDSIAEIDRMDLLKIDVQGAEVAIFESGQNKLKEAVAVITELRFFPLYEDEPLLDAQIDQLSKAGLRMHKFLHIKRQQVANSQSSRLRRRAVSSQILDGDAVFVRDLRQTDDVSNEQLKALAVLADAVFESYDLVLHCLDLLVSRGVVTEDIPDRYTSQLPEGLRREARR